MLVISEFRKNDFLSNNDIESTNDTVILYTNTRGYTSIASPKISWSYFAKKEWNIFQSKNIMNMSALLMCFANFHVQYVNFFHLKLPCWMKHMRKNKELEFFCIIFKTCTMQICSLIFYFLFHHKMWFGFWS